MIINQETSKNLVFTDVRFWLLCMHYIILDRSFILWRLEKIILRPSILVHNLIVIVCSNFFNFRWTFQSFEQFFKFGRSHLLGFLHFKFIVKKQRTFRNLSIWVTVISCKLHNLISVFIRQTSWCSNDVVYLFFQNLNLFTLRVIFDDCLSFFL